MIALVTGANGFVGSHLVDLLLESGYQVRCLVRGTSDLRWLEGKNVELRHGGILDPSSLAGAVRGADYVFHVAGITRARRREDFLRVNGEGTRNLAEACAKHAPGVRKIVYCSSLAAGGPAPSSRPIDEESPAVPHSTYGRSKLEGEIALLRLADRLSYSIVRPPAI